MQQLPEYSACLWALWHCPELPTGHDNNTARMLPWQFLKVSEKKCFTTDGSNLISGTYDPYNHLGKNQDHYRPHSCRHCRGCPWLI